MPGLTKLLLDWASLCAAPRRSPHLLHVIGPDLLQPLPKGAGGGPGGEGEASGHHSGFVGEFCKELGGQGRLLGREGDSQGLAALGNGDRAASRHGRWVPSRHHPLKTLPKRRAGTGGWDWGQICVVLSTAPLARSDACGCCRSRRSTRLPALPYRARRRSVDLNGHP